MDEYNKWYGKSGDAIHIDSGVWIKKVSYQDQWSGIIIGHIHPNGYRCFGSVLFDLPHMDESFKDQAKWQVQSFDPLTLSPSIHQVTCGLHGFIQQGKWVPC